MVDELVDIVNEQDEVLENILKSEAHQKGLLHRCVIGGVKTSDGRIMLVKQTADRQDPGQHVSPVGGHVKSGESLDEALLRETLEELGLEKFGYKLIGKKAFNREVIGRKENHLFCVYEITTDEIPNLGDEAESFVYYTKDELKRLLKEQPTHFGDAYHFVAREFYPEYLN
jgi:8-oxo-dGTP pyrophosphatase MutT (NUDIX family)